MDGPPTKTRIRLNVPYAQKDQAKRLGARWNPSGRFWYVPEGEDPQKFKRWFPAVKTPSPIIIPTPTPTPTPTPPPPPPPTKPSTQVTPRPNPPQSSKKFSGWLWLIGIVAAYLLYQCNHVSNTPTHTPTAAERKFERYRSSGYRACYRYEAIGAVCGDGWRSHSTGPGTCSNHGGVHEYICPPRPQQQ